MWEAIKTRNLGADRVKEARLQTLITEFENMKMLDNGTIDEYAAKLSGIASKSATLEEVMSEHKLVKKFLTILPRRFVHIVVALEQVLDLKTTGFEDVVGLNIPTGIMTQAEEKDVAHTLEVVDEVEAKDVVRITRKTKCSRCDQYGHFVSKCPERNRNHEVNLNETQEKGVYDEEGTFFMMNHIQEMIFMNEEKYTPPKSESNTDEDDVWYFDNGASNHMIGARKKLDSNFKIVGFLQCVHEKAVYRKVSNGEFIIVSIYGADLFVTGASLDLINEFKRRMESQFEMSDPGELTYYLGIEVSQGNDCIEIKQERYTMKILKEPGMEDCNPALCPMEPRLKLTLPDSRNVTSLRLPPRCLSRLLCFQLHIVMFGYIDVDVTIFLHSK
ncbi:uncharacterized mitochondrial protein-like protein [Tanacetum coccineum]